MLGNVMIAQGFVYFGCLVHPYRRLADTFSDVDLLLWIHQDKFRHRYINYVSGAEASSCFTQAEAVNHTVNYKS